MLKQKTYDVTQTNIANLGSDLEKKVRLSAADTEQAWANAGQKEGTEVWRIENFKVVPVPKNQFGQFFNGDSYIVLKTYKVADALHWDVHFWLGEYTSQDEAGTAAYKTVELDDKLGTKPVQHREISGHESDRFLSYFNPPGMRLLNGGVASGFNNVKPTEYKPRLLHIKGTRKSLRVTEVPLSADSLNSGDVFILDLGLKLIQWVGKQAGIAEKAKATALARAFDDERGGKVEIQVLAEGESGAEEFWKLLGGEKPIKSAAEGGADAESAGAHKKQLFKLSDASGSLSFSLVAEGTVSKSLLDTNDAFILDVGAEVFVWIGLKASVGERKAAMGHAQAYLTSHNRPAHLPISRVMEGGENEVFISYLDK